jgi:hypothetical protein
LNPLASKPRTEDGAVSISNFKNRALTERILEAAEELRKWAGGNFPGRELAESVEVFVGPDDASLRLGIIEVWESVDGCVEGLELSCLVNSYKEQLADMLPDDEPVEEP